jgi:hypothetical protein
MQSMVENESLRKTKVTLIYFEDWTFSMEKIDQGTAKSRERVLIEQQKDH